MKSNYFLDYAINMFIRWYALARTFFNELIEEARMRQYAQYNELLLVDHVFLTSV
jgi:hypothetical protein